MTRMNIIGLHWYRGHLQHLLKVAIQYIIGNQHRAYTLFIKYNERVSLTPVAISATNIFFYKFITGTDDDHGNFAEAKDVRIGPDLMYSTMSRLGGEDDIGD